MKAAPSQPVSCILADTEVKHPLEVKASKSPFEDTKSPKLFFRCDSIPCQWVSEWVIHSFRFGDSYGISKLCKLFFFAFYIRQCATMYKIKSRIWWQQNRERGKIPVDASQCFIAYFAQIFCPTCQWRNLDICWKNVKMILTCHIGGQTKNGIIWRTLSFGLILPFFYLFVVENWLHHFYRTQVNLWSDLWDVMQT